MLPAGPRVLSCTGSGRLSASDRPPGDGDREKATAIEKKILRPAGSTPSTQRGNGWPGFQVRHPSQSGLASAGERDGGAGSQNYTRTGAAPAPRGPSKSRHRGPSLSAA